MTGKEALKDLRHSIQALFITMPNVYDDTKIIEKDLEVLEILKPYIRVYKDVLLNGRIYYFLNGLETDKETYDKVKEWLEK